MTVELASEPQLARKKKIMYEKIYERRSGNFFFQQSRGILLL